MDAGHVNVILGEAEDKGLRGSINLEGGAKISFDFNGILVLKHLSIAIQRAEHL